MSTKNANLKILYERRDKLRVDLEAAKARLDEVDNLIRLLGGEAPAAVPPAETRARRGDLKALVLDLYEAAGEAGLSSAACVAMAKERGNEQSPRQACRAY